MAMTSIPAEASEQSNTFKQFVALETLHAAVISLSAAYGRRAVASDSPAVRHYWHCKAHAAELMEFECDASNLAEIDALTDLIGREAVELEPEWHAELERIHQGFPALHQQLTASDFPVTSQQQHGIDQMFLERAACGHRPSAQPTLTYIIGQPASGKSSSVKRVAHTLTSAPLYLDSDKIREAHPQIKAIMREDPLRMDVLSNAIVGSVVGHLMARARASKLNIILENTLTNREVVTSTVEQCREAGYKVQFIVLATPAPVSRLGIIDRYLGALRGVGTAPRWTSLAAHDGAYRTIPNNLNGLEGVADSILITDRAGSRHYSGTSTREAAAALTATREDLWNADTQHLYYEQLASIVPLMLDTEFVSQPSVAPVVEAIAEDAAGIGVKLPGLTYEGNLWGSSDR